VGNNKGELAMYLGEEKGSNYTTPERRPGRGMGLFVWIMGRLEKKGGVMQNNTTQSKG